MGFLHYQSVKDIERQILANNWSRVTMVTEIIKNGLVRVMLEGRAEQFQTFMQSVISEDIEAVRLLAPDGRVISSTDPSDIGKDVLLSSQKPTAEIANGLISGKPVYLMTVPIFNDNSCSRCHPKDRRVMGILNVEISTRKSNASIGDTKEHLLLMNIFAILVSAVLIGLVTSIIVNRPLRGIGMTMDRVKNGEMDVRFVTERRDEIGRLAANLNSMLAELSRTRQELDICHVDSMKRVEKMATIGELAAVIAHEIKNPLAGISGAIQVLAEDFPKDDPRREIFSEVLNEIERLDRAVRDLLTFARPAELHPILTSLVPVIERARSQIKSLAEKSGTEVDVSVKEDLEIYIDPEQIQQVFLNIMYNAMHSMPDGGRLSISIGRANEPGFYEVAFTDTGKGIASADIDMIFKPFFTTKQMGTGLGLAISKNIVEKHKGNIIVDSRLGLGTTFRVILPLESLIDVKGENTNS